MTARPPRGFTLVELIVTLALLGVLAMVAAPMAEIAVQRSREQALREALREIRTALDRHKRAADQGVIAKQPGESGYPPNLEVLTAGVPIVGDKDGRRLYLLRRLPRDPFAAPEFTDARSWGLRSYSSPPDAPRSGEDVFDVYSRSNEKGLDGRPYREW